MRLSEAIRLGAMLKPQGYEMLIDQGDTCALGAAFDACGLITEGFDGFSEEDYEARVFPLFPLLRQATLPCPACGFTPYIDGENFTDNIAHLNDEHRWTRERIADWVATVEAAQAMEVTRTEDAVARATA